MIKILTRYISYSLFAPHRRGFGVHSPFVYNLVRHVLPQKDDEGLCEILAWRKELSHDKTILQTINSGAGSKVHNGKGRSIGQIAVKSSIRHKYGRVLYALCREFKPVMIIELGTGIGISLAYMAKACPDSKLISIENDKEKLKVAAYACEKLGLTNVELINGYFKDVLNTALKDAVHPLLIFVDGDHSFEATLYCFNEIKKHKDDEAIVVFDDIRWSGEMEKAWGTIKKDPEVMISIDLFFMGIVFFRGGISRQEFVINF